MSVSNGFAFRLGVFAACLVLWLNTSAASGQPERPRRGAKAARTPAPLQRTLEAARSSTNAFRQPEDWGWAGLSVLNVRPARITIPGAGANGGPQDFEVLSYNGRSFGPTIRARRGSTFRIRVRNHLHAPAGVDEPDRPCGLCTTNLHTHGLHVSPADPGDNVYRCIEPGGSHTFEYQVPADHPSGTYWYHPHKHGSVGYQVSNGLAGALIVDGSDDDSIADLEDVPEIAAARDRIFLFQQYNYVIGADGIGRIDAAAIYNPADNPDYPRSCEEIDLHASPGAAGGTAITINGVVAPVIEMAPGEVQRWRFIHAGIEQEQHMVWTDQAGDELASPNLDPTAPQFLEIARDGLATGDIKVRPVVDLYPGYRSDVLVQAPPLRNGEKQAVYHIKKIEPATALKLRPEVPSDVVYLAKVVVRGGRRAMKLPSPAALKPCRPFQPIGDGELSPPTVGDKGLITFSSNDDALRYEINGKEFHEHQGTPGRIQLGTAQEWRLKALANNHPFHIHVNAFQVTGHVNANGDPVNDGVGDWKDTLFVPEGHTLTIRSRFTDYAGQTVFHCHILDHEDQGMMMPLEFRDGLKPLPLQEICHAMKPAPNAPPKLAPSAARAPRLRLRELGGSMLDLSSMRGRPVVLVFFQGATCPHCVSQLRDLLRESRRSDVEAPILAVSSQPIEDAERARKLLGTVAGDRFRILIDEEHRAFKDFDCYGDAPLHGVFVIDREGVVRAEYRGAAPFQDSAEVLRRVRMADPGADRSSGGE